MERYLLGMMRIGLVLALAGCGARGAAPPPEVRPVVALPAQAAQAAAAASYHGEIRARDEASLGFRVGGKLLDRRVRLGDTVRRGELLARLDGADLEREVAIDAANLDAADGHVVLAQAQLSRTGAEHGQGLAAATDLEQATDASTGALAARDGARARLELARQQLGYAELHADQDGVITREDAQPGQVVAAGQSIFGFAANAEREVVIDVPEAGRAALVRGSVLAVTLPALPGRTYRAQVRDVAAAADAASRTFTVKAVLNDAGPEVALGMSADAAVAGRAPASDQVSVPATAIFHDGERPAVWIVDPAAGKLALRPVVLGAYGGRSVALAGVKAGEMVVVAGVHTLQAADAVRVVAPLHPDDGQP